MILVVGALGSGKTDYVKSLGYAGQAIANATLDDTRPVLDNLHELLKNHPPAGEEAGEALFEALLKKEVVICNEVGCGVVPITAQERDWRDNVGRTCARLAAKATRVVRLCCGIPQTIKGAAL